MKVVTLRHLNIHERMNTNQHL